jgi:thiamine biosynthesis lipoprotein
MEEAFEEIERFGDRINFYSEKSELSEINRNAGIRKTRVSTQTLDVIEKAIAASEKSEGSFDPTIGPVVKLWDFLNKKRPTDEEIRRTLPLVSHNNVIIDKTDATVFLKKKGMMLDLGGIAKGYAADLAVESLKRRGISSGLVSIAGDIRTFGLKPDKSPWSIGIRNPRQTGEKDEISAMIRLTDQAISTSGDYERYFIDHGKRYHHLLDPKTGYPASASRSVSIVTDRAVDTDAFSTAVFILGPEKGMMLAKKLGMEALIIDSNGARHMTDAIKEKISFEKGN